MVQHKNSDSASGASSFVEKTPDGEGGVVALKRARTSAFNEVLLHEAESLVWLDHPAFASLLDVTVNGLNHELVALRMSWVSAASMDVMYEQSIDHSTLLRMVIQLGDALDYLESLDIAHGDIKPQNILVDPTSGRLWLIDFGLSSHADERHVGGGSLRYLHQDDFTASSARQRDRFALGVVLAELIDANARTSEQPASTFLGREQNHPLAPVVRSLLSPEPSARPRPSFVSSCARSLLDDSVDFTLVSLAERHARTVRSTYLSVRRDELSGFRSNSFEVDRSCAGWLRETTRLLYRINTVRRSFEPRGVQSEQAVSSKRVQPLATAQRLEWLCKLCGPQAARWPVHQLDSLAEEELAQHLENLAKQKDPRSWFFSDVLRSSRVTVGSLSSPVELADPVTLALALGRTGSLGEAFTYALDQLVRGALPQPLVTEVLRGLIRQGAPELVLYFAERFDWTDPRLGLVAAEAARRLSNHARCVQIAEKVAEERSVGGSSIVQQINSVVARSWLSKGDVQTAMALVGEPDSNDLGHNESDLLKLEVRSLCLVQLGQLDRAAEVAQRAVSLAVDDESQTRALGLLGYVSHAQGRSLEAERCYELASQAAERAGAMVEMATYLTGVAAAATDRMLISKAISASERAVALWASLQRPNDACRALLSRASCFRLARQLDEAALMAQQVVRVAQRIRDTRAECYAWLVYFDATIELKRADLSLSLFEHAFSLVSQSESDSLRVAARSLAYGLLDLPMIEHYDRTAERCAVVAQLEWWTARINKSLDPGFSGPTPRGRLQDALALLLRLSAEDSPVDLRGSALDACRRLAARLGDGAASRRCRALQAALCSPVLLAAPVAFRDAIARADWVAAAHTTDEPSGITAEQVDDALTIVRALTSRQQLRPLLEQVLDALILWTGVERGVLLLRAPNETLVPRAARNLSRDVLKGEQLQLSTTIATRAVRERRTVVAVDAAGESVDTRASVHALQLRSVLAVPLIVAGEVLGAVYLDDRSRRGAFGPVERGWVDLLASIASLAIADVRDQLLLRRSLRRAERARVGLVTRLEEQTTQLDELALNSTKTAPIRGARLSVFSTILGRSPLINESIHLAQRVAKTDIPVLLAGESGVGKELFARAIHGASTRQSGLFVSENCAAIPETLLEATLFGYVRGAFTGAVNTRRGLFEIAHNGTLFLDEIGDMPMPMQTKLLRVLQDGEVRPLGSNVSRHVNVRLVAATHRNLKQMVQSGQFREDLYYRLCVVELRIPALRERQEDIAELVQHFLKIHSPLGPKKISSQALKALQSYSWPGNVRQLENEIRRALILCEQVIEREHLSEELLSSHSAQQSVDSLQLRERVDALEAELVIQALQRAKGNQSKAATLLGISRFGLQKMIRRLQIEIETVASKGEKTATTKAIRGKS